MTMEQTACSETSAYKIQTLRNYPEESIQHSEHGKSLKSRIDVPFSTVALNFIKKANISFLYKALGNHNVSYVICK